MRPIITLGVRKLTTSEFVWRDDPCPSLPGGRLVELLRRSARHRLMAGLEDAGAIKEEAFEASLGTEFRWSVAVHVPEALNSVHATARATAEFLRQQIEVLGVRQVDMLMAVLNQFSHESVSDQVPVVVELPSLSPHVNGNDG